MEQLPHPLLRRVVLQLVLGVAATRAQMPPFWLAAARALVAAASGGVIGGGAPADNPRLYENDAIARLLVGHRLGGM
eukprot:CAMPEP_0179837892 /NCGR_PEP_ID=MMETSP0982-20121206/327_1 /TAXON_ID=483367 /ORGANISM="non described non described, Strain CCMP 2436" /LENGTH=76 /DNA_ID=CAMNT_0021721111 /DNA_START=675 /DNA_END=905 /DNA_ORIENTATION=+